MVLRRHLVISSEISRADLQDSQRRDPALADGDPLRRQARCFVAAFRHGHHLAQKVHQLDAMQLEPSGWFLISAPIITANWKAG